MISYELGQIVRSKAGRDKDAYFLIVGIEEDFLLLANGESRKIDEPKRKKKKHVQITHLVDEKIAGALKHDNRLTNAEIRKSLKAIIDSHDGNQ